jgi:hypothetical protein
MFFRRLVAGLLVLGICAGLTLPAIGREKDKDKGKDKDKDTGKGGENVTLAWKFEKDKPFYQKMVTKTEQNMKVLGNDVKQSQNQTFFFSFKPTKVEKDKVEIEQEIIGVEMDIEIGGSKISYNSQKDATVSNPLGDFFKALVGSKFTISLDPKTNKVTNVEGREQFIQKLVAANPQMKQLLDTILSKEALKEMAEPTFAVVPPKGSAHKGEKWSRKATLDMGPIGKYENEYTYLLEGVDGTGDKAAAKIKVDTTLNYTAPAETSQGGLPFKIKSAALKSNSEAGQVVFNPTKGRLEKSTLKLKLKGQLDIEIGGQQTKVDLEQNQDSTIETLDDNPIKKK